MKQRFDFNGERLTLREVADRLCVPYDRLYRRMKKGFSFEKTVATANIKGFYSTVCYKGEEMSLRELSDKTGIPYMRLWDRIRKLGLTPEEAVTATTGDLRRKKRMPCPYPDCDNCPYPDCVA